MMLSVDLLISFGRVVRVQQIILDWKFIWSCKKKRAKNKNNILKVLVYHLLEFRL